MSVLDDEYSSRFDDYITTRFEKYINWYIENIEISKKNFFAALIVIAICNLCFLFIPNPIEQMNFFHYSFDPTFAIKLGLLISIGLAFFSMFTSYKKMRICIAGKSLLQSEYKLFKSRVTNNSGPNEEISFAAFIHAVDDIILANNPEVVTVMTKDNALKDKTQETTES